jgi:hypothetical protein
MSDPHSIERPIEIGGPEIKKIDELREVWRHVIVLPERRK